MSLEAIEQQTLSYLSQVTNPLVRIDVLLAHLHDRGIAESLDAARLKDFLARHDLFRVIEPTVPPADFDASRPEALGPGGAYVILATRVPTPEQVTAMMLEQLAALEQALVSARAQALDEGEPARVGPIEEALRRIAALRQKLASPPKPSRN